jgi:hypothetical protein
MPDRGPATLVWIGPTQGEHVAPAFDYCARHAPQIATRHSIDHWLRFPAQMVSHVVIYRDDRQLPAIDSETLGRTVSDADCWMMLGSAGEGESRTGDPWPGFRHFYWHRWNQVIPGWFAENSEDEGNLGLRQSILVVTETPDLLDAVFDDLRSRGHAVAMVKAPDEIPIANVDLCIWDDTAAPPTGVKEWTTRIAPFRQNRGGARASVATRHLWIAGFPRLDSWRSAKRAGVDMLISKPFALEALARLVRALQTA